MGIFDDIVTTPAAPNAPAAPTTDALDSLWASVANAETTKSTPYMEPGTYIIYLEELKRITAKMSQDTLVIIEGTILKSNHETLTAGNRVCQIINTKYPSAPANIKAFLEAAANRTLNAKQVGHLMSPQNPLKGTLVKATAFIIKTRKGTDFTKIEWEPIGPEEQAKAKELLAEALAVK